jgi:hypothetical protein
MHKASIFIKSACFIAFASGIVMANHVMVDTTINGLRIELHVLAAEPFFTKQQVTANKITEGMLIVRGEKPLAQDAATHPNHHLVVHVFDAKTGKAITNANVKMIYQAVSDKGEASGNATPVPVVVMQAIGKGAESTHYGNNVVMPNGSYVVTVVVNNNKIDFTIHLGAASGGSMDHMHM